MCLCALVQDRHPHPGQRYKGTHRRAFLPDSTGGREVLALLTKAFDARLLFTVGHSVNTGQENVVVWNDVHQKSSTHGQYVFLGCREAFHHVFSCPLVVSVWKLFCFHSIAYLFISFYILGNHLINGSIALHVSASLALNIGRLCNELIKF